ncbi:MAG: DUF2313 domain-containing protein [Aerococcus sp.]|nr:DUF2313 domain-containing protein [Aerococcus sp.]
MMKLLDLMPDYYLGNLEMQTLMQIDQKLLEGASEQMDKVAKNQYIKTADAATLSYYETIFHIPVQVGDSLEDRRFRLLAKIASRTTYTKKYFMSLFKEFFDFLNVEMVYNDYLVKINIDKESAINLDMVNYLINTMIVTMPANLVLVKEERVPFNGELFVASSSGPQHSRLQLEKDEWLPFIGEMVIGGYSGNQYSTLSFE